jgi:hypothetical protein
MAELESSGSDSSTRDRVPIAFQVICIVLSLAWFTFVINRRLAMFNPQEQGPELVHITPPIYKKFGGFANFVTIGLFIDRFQTFDITNNAFVFTGYVWFKYLSGTMSITDLEKFYFLQGEILERSDPETQVIDQYTLTTFHVKVRFSSVLSYKDFPFDGHRIRISISHNNLSPEEVVFQSAERDMIVKSDEKQVGWHKIDQSVDTGFLESDIDSYDKRKTQYHPAATFSVDYERHGIRFILSIFLPLLLIFYVTLFGFSLDDGSALRNAVGGVTGILGYRFVIDNFSPKVGYFMVSDSIFFLILSLTCFTLVLFIVTVFGRATITMRMKAIILIMLHLLINSLSAYFFFA